MLPKFNNLIELLRNFPDDSTCRKYLENKRWSGQPQCPHCNSIGAYKLNDGKTYKCKQKACYKKFTVTVGTVFENSNIPLNTWFAAVYLATAHKKGISSLQLHRDLGITQKTAWFMLHRIRESFKINAPEMLENVVEADETFIGGKNKNRHADKKVPESQGRSVKDKTPVFGLLQRGGKVVTNVVADTKGETLKPIINDVVSDNSVVITDEWLGYSNLSETHNHVVINHSQNEYVRGAFDTNSIEGFWSLLKRGIFGIYHSVSPRHLHRYCEEFSYRYNNRHMKDAERFDISLQHIDGRLTYFTLTRKIKCQKKATKKISEKERLTMKKG